MSGESRFGLIVAVIGLAGVAAVLSNRLSARFRIPAPAIFLVAAVIVAQLWPAETTLSAGIVERLVTLALMVILFDGGMHIGLRRFRTAGEAIVWTGIAGTLVTAAGTAVAAHYVAGMDWHLALLVGTAVAATDPAVVFSVFGRREIAGRTGVLLEGESGANDPVGIALLTSLLAAHGGTGTVIWHVVASFALQMAVGVAVGVAGGLALLAFMRKVPLPSEGLYSPRVLASVLAIFGIATVAQGSGFLAVLVAGIVIGDEPAPYKREIERFHSSLASLAEIVAFVMLGLTMRLSQLASATAWAEGLALAALLAFVIRPVLVGLISLPIRLSRPERVFFLWTGLKGAVPILLGMTILDSGTAGAARAYQIIFVIVGFSVTVQGGLVPAVAHRLRIPLRTIEPEPWSLGVRFSEEPEGLHRYHVAGGSAAEGAAVTDLPCSENAWISLVIRDGNLVTVTGDTRLRADDDVLVLADPDEGAALERFFTGAGGSRPALGDSLRESLAFLVAVIRLVFAYGRVFAYRRVPYMPLIGRDHGRAVSKGVLGGRRGARWGGRGGCARGWGGCARCGFAVVGVGLTELGWCCWCGAGWVAGVVGEVRGGGGSRFATVDASGLRQSQGCGVAGSAAGRG